jgi:hypothetical protein
MYKGVMSYLKLKKFEKMTVVVFNPEGGEQGMYMDDKVGSDDVTLLVLQVYIWDHIGSLDNPNRDT